MAERDQQPDEAIQGTAPPFSPWRQYLLAPVDGASLAVFRIFFGLIMLVEVGRYFASRWIADYYIQPEFHFTYPFFSWVQPWSGFGMYLHFGLLGLFALLLTLGWFYRAAAWGFFLGFSYVFLLDEAKYLNHYYLVCLLSFLLAIVPTNNAWSLDAKMRPSRYAGTVPRFSVFLLRAQITLVYFYAGVAKLNEDWLLHAEPLRSWLEGRDRWPLVALLLKVPGSVWLMVYGSTVIDLLAGFLLWGRRTFWPAVVVLVLFHGMNFYLFHIGIFPWLMLATLTLFGRPDWPRKLLRRPVPAGTAVIAPPAFGRPTATLGLLSLYLAIQILLPLRHWLYPGNVHWTEQGHRFSWHMMLRSKNIRFFAIFSTDPRTGARRMINPRDSLTDRQVWKMASRPHMIHLFARYVADKEETRLGVRPRVTVQVQASLNGRPWQDLIDPKVDLAAQPITVGPASWIVPLAHQSPSNGPPSAGLSSCFHTAGEISA